MMAKMFYTMDEAKAALGKTEDEVRAFSRDGRLREFRDGPRLMFKADQVDNLKSELAGSSDQISLGPSDSGSPPRSRLQGPTSTRSDSSAALRLMLLRPAGTPSAMSLRATACRRASRRVRGRRPGRCRPSSSCRCRSRCWRRRRRA